MQLELFPKEEKTVHQHLEFILEKEPEMFSAIEEVVNHIANTYQDKYEASKHLLDTKAQLYDKERGLVINIYQACKYLQRFMSIGHQKSGNKNDLKKVIHYSLFGIVCMNRHGNTKDKDIVDKQ